MTLSPRTATAILAQELWDCVVDNVDPSLYGYLDLRSCSLVCRAFTHRAQMHLFHDIGFNRPWASDNAGSGPYDQAAAGGRLSAVLKSSPHLVPFIRRICTPVARDVVAQLSGMALSKVNIIDIYAPTGYKANMRDDFAATTLLQKFIAMPSVSEVRINSGTSIGVVNLVHLFRTPSPAMVALDVSFVSFSQQNNHDLAQLKSGKPRVYIHRLRLCASKVAGAWLAHPDCPFDLSRLVVADICHSMSADLGTALGGAHTIKRLSLDTSTLQFLSNNFIH